MIKTSDTETKTDNANQAMIELNPPEILKLQERGTRRLAQNLMKNIKS